MQISQRPFSSLISRQAVVLAIVLVIASIALTGRSMFSSPTVSNASGSHFENERTVPIAVSDQTRIKVELITIRPAGFDPTEITLTDGHFRIAVDNKSGLDEVTLRLTREGGARVRGLRLSPEQHKWREKIVLPPGSYLLTAVGHPNWLCRITVTP